MSENKNTKSTEKKPEVKVRDLQPKKDAKGGSMALYGSSHAGSGHAGSGHAGGGHAGSAGAGMPVVLAELAGTTIGK